MIWITHTAFIHDCSFDRLRLQNGPEHLLFDQNVLVYGSSGCGKKTYVQKWASHTFSCGDWEYTSYPIKTDKRCDTWLHTRKSYKHTELMFDCSNLSCERYWIRHVVKPLCQQLVLASDGSLSCHYIILYNCHVLSARSLTLLHRYTTTFTNCIFIIVATQQAEIHRILCNTMLSLRFKQPSFHDQSTYVRWLCESEQTPFDEDMFRAVFDKHGGELYKTLVDMAMRIDNVSNKYLNLITYVTTTIMTKTLPLKRCRPYLYTLIVNNIPPSQVMSDLCKCILSACPDDLGLCRQVVASAAYYEHLCLSCERPIYHYDAFISELAHFIDARRSNHVCIS